MPGGSCERCNATKRGASLAAVAGKRSLHTAERERRARPRNRPRVPRGETARCGQSMMIDDAPASHFTMMCSFV